MRRKNTFIKLPGPVSTLVKTSVLLCCAVPPSEEQTEVGPPLAFLACSFFGVFSLPTFHSLSSSLQKSFRYLSDKLHSSFLTVILSTLSSYPPSVGQRKKGSEGWMIWLHLLSAHSAAVLTHTGRSEASAVFFCGYIVAAVVAKS